MGWVQAGCEVLKKTDLPEDNPNAFKHWINAQVVETYALGLKKFHSELDSRRFRAIVAKFPELELRARVRLIAETLREVLPQEYPKALRALLGAIRAQKMEGFALWPATEFIQLHGLNHFDLSFEAMRELTALFTAEFAVRPFVTRDLKRACAELERAARDGNVHLRRWASEGLRPRLPWGERLHALIQDPTPCLRILELLRFDPEVYVRKSVANHLNDISKDHPEVVVKTLQAWAKEVPRGFEKEFHFILNRALRTLVKKGDARALKLLGVAHGDPALSIDRFQLSAKEARIGGSIEMSLRLKNHSKSERPFVLDYAIHHRKANGETSAKVFKLRSGRLRPGAEVEIRKAHSFKRITTRVYYPGVHGVEILLNGKPLSRLDFRLLSG